MPMINALCGAPLWEPQIFKVIEQFHLVPAVGSLGAHIFIICFKQILGKWYDGVSGPLQ